jgi:hypothetical protein
MLRAVPAAEIAGAHRDNIPEGAPAAAFNTEVEKYSVSVFNTASALRGWLLKRKFC